MSGFEDSEDDPVWDNEDVDALRELLEMGERAKWKYIAGELTKERNKRVTAQACQKKFKDMFGVAEASSTLGSSLGYVVSPSGWECLGDDLTPRTLQGPSQSQIGSLGSALLEEENDQRDFTDESQEPQSNSPALTPAPSAFTFTPSTAAPPSSSFVKPNSSPLVRPTSTHSHSNSYSGTPSTSITRRPSATPAGSPPTLATTGSQNSAFSSYTPAPGLSAASSSSSNFQHQLTPTSANNPYGFPAPHSSKPSTPSTLVRPQYDSSSPATSSPFQSQPQTQPYAAMVGGYQQYPYAPAGVAIQGAYQPTGTPQSYGGYYNSYNYGTTGTTTTGGYNYGQISQPVQQPYQQHQRSQSAYSSSASGLSGVQDLSMTGSGPSGPPVPVNTQATMQHPLHSQEPGGLDGVGSSAQQQGSKNAASSPDGKIQSLINS